ncbi:peptidoglycan-binding protein [Mycolicibacterium goodii]|uniref:peptidoglycan-binding protein n=1 Tax=Mycolicibacterium goodii TaxID=134601 RepID=UPI001BDD6F2D|nr:peptidoglycan-binding protein [Mycolicibacterium goodii]MBU8833586.1 peptidoglycan-binding protein [Mycolicibacterium goodii]
MTARLPLKLGSSDARGDDVTHWQRWARAYAESYANLMGPVDGYYGNSDAEFTREMQRRLVASGRAVAITGVFDEATAAGVGYAGAPPAEERRPIWIYTAPGSGAPWNVGPAFELGVLCEKILKLNHQPVGYPIGGYLGLMGGDPAFSYLDVIGAQAAEFARLLRINPDVVEAMEARRRDPAAHVDVEIWVSGYSQSADGFEDALEHLFGDGGEFELIRDRLNGVIQFGNPSKDKTGIARKTRPLWLLKLITNVTVRGDFYAEATDEIRPLFYEWFIRAETELPFVIYSAQVILPALLNLVAPFLTGGLSSPLAAPILAGVTGASGGLLNTVIGGVLGAKDQPNPKLIELLSIRGVLTNLGELIKLIAALPGVQAHGEYHLPKPEFGGRTGIQVAYDVVAAFRR